MSEYTPGPWICQEGEITDASGDVFIAELVARDRPAAVQNPNEAEANAQLIIAAPDLLNACKRAYAVERSVTQGQERELRDGYLALLNAAIEKAESRNA